MKILFSDSQLVRIHPLPKAQRTDAIQKDGGPGSGNHGHEGRPGKRGGSSPSGAQLNGRIGEAYSRVKEDYGSVGREIRSTLKDAAIGASFTHKGIHYVKTGDDEFTSDNKFYSNGKPERVNANNVANTTSPWDSDTAPVFDDDFDIGGAGSKGKVYDVRNDPVCSKLSKRECDSIREKLNSAFEDEDADSALNAINEMPVGSQISIVGVDTYFYTPNGWYVENIDNPQPLPVSATRIADDIADNSSEFGLEVRNLSVNDTRMSSSTTSDATTGKGLYELDTHGESKLNQFRTLSEKEQRTLVAQALDDAYVPANLNVNSDFQRLSIALNNNDLPQKMTRKDFEAMIDRDNPTEIYRGVVGTKTMSASDIAKSLSDGESMYVGNGMFGDGIYFSDAKSTAEMYAGNGKGVVTRAAISPKAKIVDYEKINDEYIKSSFDAGIMAGSGGDVSCYALAKGYDVIAGIKGKHGDTYYNVINRSALIIMED